MDLTVQPRDNASIAGAHETPPDAWVEMQKSISLDVLTY